VSDPPKLQVSRIDCLLALLFVLVVPICSTVFITCVISHISCLQINLIDLPVGGRRRETFDWSIVVRDVEFVDAALDRHVLDRHRPVLVRLERSLRTSGGRHHRRMMDRSLCVLDRCSTGTYIRQAHGHAQWRRDRQTNGHTAACAACCLQ